jgi:hypothetical protein
MTGTGSEALHEHEPHRVDLSVSRPETARRVAEELTEQDVLAAHLAPWRVAVTFAVVLAALAATGSMGARIVWNC